MLADGAVVGAGVGTSNEVVGPLAVLLIGAGEGTEV